LDFSGLLILGIGMLVFRLVFFWSLSLLTKTWMLLDTSAKLDLFSSFVVNLLFGFEIDELN